MEGMTAIVFDKLRMVKHMAVLALLLPVSCSDGQLPGEQAMIEPDVQRIELPAEFTASDDTVVTFSVRSNRSWFVHMNDSDNPIDPSDSDMKIGWASVDVDDHENLTKVDDIVTVNLNVLRNRTTAERNGSLNFYSGGKVFISLPVVQAGAVYYLQAIPESVSALCTPDELTIAVKSNTSWTAELLDASTASATLSKSEGVDSEEIVVSFDENFQLIDKKAFVKFSAEGCEDQVVEITQSRALPYLFLDEEKTKNIIPADQSETTIYLKTNIEGVSAAIDGEFTDAAIEKISDKEFKVKFTPDGVDPAIYKTASVTVSAPEVDDVKIELKQNGLLLFDFMNAANISPAMQTTTSDNLCNHQLKVGENSYDFSIHTFYHVVNNNLLFKAGGYMIFPSIDGLTLKKIIFTFRGNASNKRTKFTIKGVGDKEDVLYSAKNVSFTIPATSKEYVTHSMDVGTEDNPPQPGASYRVCQGASSNCHVRYISLLYE